jgi:hypothetical protein
MPPYAFLDGPFRLAMGLHALEPGAWLEAGPDTGPQMAERRRLLAERSAEVVGGLPESAAAQRELWALLLEYLPMRFPEVWRPVAGALVNRDSGERFPVDSMAPLSTIGRMVQEDFCLTALSQLNLSIQDAKIYSSKSGHTIDTFFVLNENGEPLGNNPTLLKQIQQALIEELSLVDNYRDVIGRRTPRRLKYFASPTRTSMNTDMIRNCSVLEVISPDRPGLLACIGRIFMDFDIQLLNAKIATLGERVEDIFFITDANGKPLSDLDTCEKLQQEICEQLDKRVDKL